MLHCLSRSGLGARATVQLRQQQTQQLLRLLILQKSPFVTSTSASQLQQLKRIPAFDMAQFYRRPLPETCIDFSSPEGKVIFKEALEAGCMERYFKLAAQFRTQDEPAFCGLSTLVMCLNSLEIDPGRVWKGPWRWYHEDMLDCCVPIDMIRKEGITLDEFVCLADCNGLHLKVTRCDDTADFEKFRALVKENSKTEDEILVCSYSRKILKQTGDGHFTPLAGYHPGRDLVLLLDSARFKYPPHWVKLETLYQAMQAHDAVTKRSRGYALLSKQSNVSSLLVFKICSTFSQLMMQQTKEKKPVSDSVPESLANVESILNFVQAFEKWLAEPHSENASEDTIFKEALVFLLHTFEKVGQTGQFILSTQRDFKDKAIHKHDGNCTEHHDTIIEELLAELRGLQEYQIAKELFAQSSVKIGCCEDHDDSISTVETPAMFAMFVLSWPNKLCGGTQGALLKNRVQTILEHAPDCLRGEVAQIKKQISVVYGRYKSCHCSGKC